MKHSGRITALLIAGVTAAAVLLFALLGRGRLFPPGETPSPTPEAAPTPEPGCTLRLGLTEFPRNWSPFAYASTADAELVSYLSAGLYAFDYNETGDGCRLVPCMAAGAPEDVTEQYLGAFGLQAGDRALAWRIPLREDLCWQDGTAIDAGDFVASAQRLLDPAAANPRADLFCSGALAIRGAREYQEQKQPIHRENMLSQRWTLEDLSPGEDGVYCTPEGQKVSLGLDYPLEHLLYGKTLRFYVETYGDSCFDLTPWASLLTAMDRDGLVPLTEENLALFLQLTTGNPAWGDGPETLPAYFVCDEAPPAVPWDSVGILARSPRELVLILSAPLEGFDLRYALTDCWLVYTPLYDRCASANGKHYVNSYGTSPETTASCGPYVLAELTPEEGYTLARNPRYFGLTDGEGEALYQTTQIRGLYVPEDGERLRRFLAGELDLCVPGPEAEGDPALTGSTLTIPGDTTYLLLMNPDPEGLAAAQSAAGEQVNKTILTLHEFRRALCLSLDREAFCREVSPRTQAAYTLYTPLILADTASGVPYRSTDQARAVEARYAEEAAYDPAAAREAFDLAWQQACALGLTSEEDVVELCIGIPSADSEYFNRGYDFLVRAFTQGAKGSALEGRLRFVRSDDLGSGSYSALRTNKVDLLFGVGWAGRATDPVGMMDAYVGDEARWDPGWDTSGTMLSIPARRTEFRASVQDWYAILCGGTRPVTMPDGTVMDLTLSAAGYPLSRLDILAALEARVLEEGNAVPLSCGFVRQLRSERLVFPSEQYLFGVGFGGVKYLRYRWDDAAWDARRAG